MSKELDIFNQHHQTNIQMNYLKETRSLIALQGPKAAVVLQRLLADSYDLSTLSFMYSFKTDFNNIILMIYGLLDGYTGEDGFEISIPSNEAVSLWQLLKEQAEVLPAALAARDSLRLEAGLCLYGHDIDENTTPIEAGLNFTISKRRRQNADFIGAKRILEQINKKLYTN